MKFIFLYLILFLILFSSCSQSQYYIEKHIEEANYCTIDDDCVLINSKCPFDCYVAINKENKSKIIDLIKNYKSKCVYSCIQVKGVECSQNKCILIK